MRVSHFNHLGLLSDNNGIKVEINIRLKKGNITWVYLYDINTPSNILCVRTWPFGKTEEIRLGIFERKILRRIFGPYKDSQTGEWRKRHNQEL